MEATVSRVPAEAGGDRSRVRAMVAIGAALVAGVATQALFWRASAGLSWVVLDAMLVVATMLALRVRAGDAPSMRRPALASAIVASAALALGGAVAYRASDWALYVALPASAALLALLPFVAAGRMRVRDLGTLPRALVRRGVCEVPGAIGASFDLPRRALDETGRSHALRVVKGMAIGLPVTCVFAALLAADPNFRRALARVAGASDGVAHFGALALITAVGYLFAYVLHARTRDRAEVDDAVSPTPVEMPLPYRRYGDLDASVPTPRGPLVRPLTWGVVLAQLVAVFGIFVAANAKYLFGGHALVTAKGTPTYAGYLHAGFAQLSVATVLAVVVVVVGQRLVRSRDASVTIARAPRIALAVCETSLLALTAITLASCAQRLRIYDEAYGYTYLRLGVGLLQLAVMSVLALTMVKALAPSWRGYGAAIALSGIGFAVFAGTLDADGWIARANVARANAGRPLDVDYLQALSADARPVLGDPYFATRPEIAKLLETMWTDEASEVRRRDWRSWRGLGACR